MEKEGMLEKASARSDADIHPVFAASPCVTGLPTTIFSISMPFATIWLTAVPLKKPFDSTNNVG